MKTPVILIIILVLFICRKSAAQSDFNDIQTFIDSNITRNFTYTNFENDLLSANLTSKINLNLERQNLNFYIKNFYSSSVTKLNKNFFRDLDNVKTGVGYTLKNGINLSANYLGMFFSDDKTIQLNGTTSNLFYGSALYDKPWGDASVYSVLNAGYKLEDQFDEKNRGPSVSGLFSIYNLNIKDYLVDGQLKLGYENLAPRKNDYVISHLYVDKSFTDNLAKNELDAVYSSTRKDFYFPADQLTMNQFGVNNNIEIRTENIFKVFDRFDYTISPKINFYLTLNPYYRSISQDNFYLPVTSTTAPSIYDTDIQEFTIASDAALRFNLQKVDLQLKASYSERDEQHLLENQNRINSNFVKTISDQEATKNNHSTLFKLTGEAYYNLTLLNRLEFAGSASIFKYDTPSDQNFDDRDELNYLIYFGHRYNNLKNLIITTSFDVNLYHTVYILAQKSSNNNWNRVLRFTSRSIFSPGDNFRNVGVFNVLANYTVYDFEDIISTVKSYSFRQLNLKDSVITNFTSHTGADVYGEIKLYERGELNWREFSIRPVNYFEDKIINGELLYFFSKFITFSGGYRFYQQSRFNYTDGIKVFDSYIRTFGPFAKLKINWKGNSRVEILGSYDYYRYSDATPSSSNSSLYVNAVWNF